MRTGSKDRNTGYAERSPRVPCTLQARARVENEELALETVDLSSTGVAVSYSGKLRVGAWMSFTFEEAPELDFSAQVVRRWRHANRACAALVFTRIPRSGTRWLSDRLQLLDGDRASTPRGERGRREPERWLEGVAPTSPIHETTDSTATGWEPELTYTGTISTAETGAERVLREIERLVLSDPKTRRGKLAERRIQLLQCVEAACHQSRVPIDEAAEIDSRLLEITPALDEEALVEIGAIRRHLRYLRPSLLRRAGLM